MQLADVKTFDQLLPWLSKNLDWPVDEIEIAPETAFDELTYEYEAKELGLKQEDIAHVREIRQLRPLVTNQPWGIFFVNFEDKKIPVGVLKRILGGLTLRKRQSANKAEQKAWTLHDLLFISSYGQTGERELSFLHFAEENGGKNKTVLKELGWDRQDTQLKLEYIERTLKSKLLWPEDTDDPDAWRTQWSSAFTTTHGATIRTAKELTKQLAALASGIRKAAGDVLEFENKNGPLTKIFENFKQTIFHNLTPADFADMYAQTICYGLLAKQIERARSGIDTKALSADDATLTQGVMQPFLKDLMETFLAVGGRKSSIDFNELGVNEVVELLQAADMTAVLLDFGNRNPHEDPVLHFYEHFLRDYDSIMREQRGVYYTPLPVVRFIVRSVHEILQKEFGLPDGLADITTWGEMVAKHPGLTIPTGVEPSAPFVQILDPATGTGTFLVEAIDQIERHLKAKWRKAGKSDKEALALWNEYVPAHLLPRLNGFELMMAPYAIAHIKLGMKLQETGYRPAAAGPRVRVFLTNTLEEAHARYTRTKGTQMSAFEIMNSLDEEARGANEIKSELPLTVIIGNPPYSGISRNNGAWIANLIDEYKYVNGAHFNERKHWLNDDYVKFYRISQFSIEQSGAGVLGLITNHAFLDNPTFRGMRFSLSESFSNLAFLDLHGNSARAETTPDGAPDQNVFQITQGVAISLLSKNAGNRTTRLLHSDLYGVQEKKLIWLGSNSLHTLATSTLAIAPPFYFFQPRQTEGLDEYGSWSGIDQIMPKNVTGVVTARDSLAIDFTSAELLEKMDRFVDDTKSDQQIRDEFFAAEQGGSDGKKYPPGDSRGWKLPAARKLLLNQKNTWDTLVKDFLYRPFDVRQIFYSQDLVDWGRWELMPQMTIENNLALLTTRQTKDDWAPFVTSTISGHKSVSRFDIGSIFPLYLFSASKLDTSVRANFDEAFVNALVRSTGLAYGFSGEPLSQSEFDGTNTITAFGPIDLFHYLYSVLHSATYRTRYTDFLKSDFPRIPSSLQAELFTRLCNLGGELVKLHLLRAGGCSVLTLPETRFIAKAEARVEKGYPLYENGKVMINPSCWFEDVTPEVWNFHIGGYQVCEKWLKDRAGKGGKNPSQGRLLSDADILHYRRITVALRETIRLMAEIDKVIDEYGGWPDAFAAA